MDTASLVMLVALIAIFYFLVIRPENKRKKAAEELRNGLKKGDKLTTIGGIVGKIVELKDENIVIETSADRVRMELARFSVMTNNTAKDAAQKARAEKKKHSNPVRRGAQQRRKAAREERERRNEFFRQSAIQAAIEKRIEQANKKK